MPRTRSGSHTHVAIQYLKLALLKVSVGVGALAGSTVMLLTLPWWGPCRYGCAMNRKSQCKRSWRYCFGDDERIRRQLLVTLLKPFRFLAVMAGRVAASR